ncbi:MAG: tRNA pseudouridine(55) synthase TruB [Gemmatimonadales bacterium]|nr:tRNA pseudouridine(55) synthase TruB [Gemmatimonadales bacterium]
MDKPAGPTSHDVVAMVRRALGTRAVGHTGTLDPFATGLLIVLCGRGTRLARFVEGQPKTYLAAARLGVRTATDDATGEPLGPPLPVAAVSEATIRTALHRFLGTQSQRPPAFSAKHVGGQRSHQLARRGKPVQLAEVSVTVRRIELVGWDGETAIFRAEVSAGTYLRALARDLGERLGTGAHLTALRREAIGGLDVSRAVAPQDVTAEAVLPLLDVLRHLPVMELDPAALRDVAHGRSVPGAPNASGPIAVLHGDEVVAVGTAEDGWLRPTVVLATP